MESCRKAVKERIVTYMLGSVVDSAGSGWKVLILDDFTTHVLSSTLRMSDILDCNVSVVEDLAKKREPLQQAAVYFIQPSPQSIARVLEDFGGPTGTSGIGKGAKQLYPSVHIFFSNKVPAEGLEKLKANPRLVKSLKTLKELNLEFLTVDSRTIITDHPEAARLLLGGGGDSSQSSMKKQLDAIVSRLATLFTSLKEFPVIRYKAAQPSQPGDPPGQDVRASFPQLLAQRLWDRLSGLQRAGQLPNKETCDMLVLDRSYDPVAPFIHEWSYEAIAYDLLRIEGNVYRYQVESQGSGKSEPREALLEESDDLWMELRHMFIADVYTMLHDRFKDFQNKNKAAKAVGGGLGKSTDSMSATSIRQLIIALPQYREVLGRLALHIQLSSELRTSTNNHNLTDVGELEQDVVLGEKTSKDLLAFLTEHQSKMDPSVKVRLLACYLATHPGKLDYAKRQQWQKTAGLTGEDMAALCEGLGRLGVRVMDTPTPSEGSKSFFGGKKKNAVKATRKKRGGEDEYALNRFQPLLHDIVSDMAAGRMSAEEFPYVRPPSSESESESAKLAASARTARSGLNWARRNQEGAGGSAAGPSGRRLVVFIIGGATRGEMRVAHQLAQQLDRDVILGSTSVDVPNTFVDLLYSIAPMKDSTWVLALQRATAHLAAQLALTYFVPLCATGCAMLARIKVLSLQLLLDCVRAYNAIADLLPLLPSSTAASPAGGDTTLLLQPALAAALQPPTGKASTAVVTESMASEPKALPGTSRAVAAMQQKQHQAQAYRQEEIRSRSLKRMLQRGPMPSGDPLQPTTASRDNNSAAGGPMATMQPPATPAAPATGPASQRLPAAAWPQIAPIPLPQMVRCRWDEHVHSAFLEPVPSGGPDQPEPTWQERAAKASERYEYMIGVQFDPQVAAMDLDPVAPLVPPSEAKRPPHSLRSAQPRAGFTQTAGGSATAATANVVAAPPSAARSGLGVCINRRSFFDLMGSKRPTGLSAVQPVASGKRVHAAQAMTHLQVIDDRVAKRQKGPNGAAAAAAVNVNVDGATAVTQSVAAKSSGFAPAAAAAVATTELAPAATATAAPLPPPAAAGPSVPDSPVVMSYTTYQGFILGLGNTKLSSGGNSGGGQGGPVQPTPSIAPASEPRCSVIGDKAADQSADLLKDGGIATGRASAGVLPRLASTIPAPSPAPLTRGSMARPPRFGAKAAFLAVPSSNPSSCAGTAGDTAGGGGGGGSGGGSGVMLPGAGAAVVPQPNPGGNDGGRLALTPGSVSTDRSADTKDDPLLGIILQGRVGERGRGRGGGGSSGTRPGLHSAVKAPRASLGAVAAEAGGGNGGGGGSLAATLDLLLGGLAASPGQGGAGGMGGRGGDTASRGGTLDPGRGSVGARGRSTGQTPKWR